MNSQEAKDFLNQLERLFGSVGECIPSATPQFVALKPKGPQDVICVSLMFRTHFMKQEFVVRFYTQGEVVNVLIIPPVGEKTNIVKSSQIKMAVTQMRVLLELEAGVFSRRQEKVQA